MTRWVSSTNAAAAAALHVCLRCLVKLDFASGFQYYHDGVGELVFAGNTYAGLGQFGSVSGGDEELDVIARPLTLTMFIKKTDLEDPSALGSAMTEEYQGRAVSLYVGIVDPNTGAFIDTPEEAWSGKMNVMTIGGDESTAEIKLVCDHRLRKEPRSSRNTDQDQRRKYATDKIFSLQYLIPGFRGAWGAQGYGYGLGSAGLPSTGYPTFPFPIRLP